MRNACKPARHPHSRLDLSAFPPKLGVSRARHACVSELRIDHGPGYRVYNMRRGALLIVLLCGGDKSTQAKDIAEAMDLAANWTDEEDEA
jgi:putative addiction module killer protein